MSRVTFTIEHSNGRTDKGYETVEDAVKQLRRDYDHLEGFEITSDEGEAPVARYADGWLAFIYPAY